VNTDRGNVKIAIAVLKTARDVRLSASNTLMMLNIFDDSLFDTKDNTFLTKMKHCCFI
jgi:hypothetical protein